MTTLSIDLSTPKMASSDIHNTALKSLLTRHITTSMVNDPEKYQRKKTMPPHCAFVNKINISVCLTHYKTVNVLLELKLSLDVSRDVKICSLIYKHQRHASQ